MNCTYIEGVGAVTVKSGFGKLHTVTVGTTSGKAVEIYDSAGSGGEKIAELKASVAEGTFEFGCNFAKGLHIVNTGGSKLTVIYG